jgi:hypothetical protein
MAGAVSATRRQCPDCGVKLTRPQWSKLWWMSGMMSGRLVQPCAECGAKLRMSSMALVSSISSAGLIGVSTLYFFYPTKPLLFVALTLLLVIFVAMLITRIETVPSTTAPIEPPPERINKKRL